jgi:magnesium chelatase subunit I
MENVISNAERRAIRNKEDRVVPRIGDIYAAMPAITGKLELEYEGEMKGADTVARELIRSAIASTYDQYFHGVNMNQVVQWFDLGGNIQMTDTASAAELSETLKDIQGLNDKLSSLGIKPKDPAETQVSAAEFVLEGLHAHKRIGRNEERIFSAGERQPKRDVPERDTRDRERFRDDVPFRNKRGFN